MSFSNSKPHFLVRNIASILIVTGLVAFLCGLVYGAYAVDFIPPQDPPPAIARAYEARAAATAQVQQQWYRAGRFLLGAGLGIGVVQTIARVLSGTRRQA